jgi:hypothetical protein
MGQRLEGAHPTVLCLVMDTIKAEFPLEQNETFSKFNQSDPILPC